MGRQCNYNYRCSTFKNSDEPLMERLKNYKNFLTQILIKTEDFKKY